MKHRTSRPIRRKIDDRRSKWVYALLLCLCTTLSTLLIVAAVGLYVSCPVNPPSYPPTWDRSMEKDLLKTITVGIISTPSFHYQVKSSAMSSWWTQERRSIARVFSDRIQHTDVIIPNVIDTGCPNSYYLGIYCKNIGMIETWKLPEFQNVKWFVRVMDDSYLHLENLYHLLQSYDPNDKIVIGDMYCKPNYTYPTGGPGIVFSRAVLDDWNWDDWMKPLLIYDQDGDDFADDILWGQYLKLRNIQMINHPGFSQAPLDPGGELLQYFLRFRELPWPLPYRPIAIHQQGKTQFMPELHRLLHSIPYEPLAKTLVKIPECTCRNQHQKCSYDHSLVDYGNCRWATQTLKCLGPGPWPGLPSSDLRDDEFRS